MNKLLEAPDVLRVADTAPPNPLFADLYALTELESTIVRAPFEY